MSHPALPAIGFIGVGELARAMVEGLCYGPGAPAVVHLSPRSAATAADLAERFVQVDVCTDNQTVVDASDIVIVAVRPDQMAEVVAGLHWPTGSTLVSVAAGVSSSQLVEWVGPDIEVVRAIPLPTVRERASLTLIGPSPEPVERLFDLLGGRLVLDDEAAFASLTAVSATVSTHLAYVATIVEWAGAHGVDGPDADRFVRTVFAGVADSITADPRPLRELAADHETPGGLNEQLRSTWLDEAGLRTQLDALLRRITGQ